ncbi:MAG: serine/threonine protein kinase [Polyangiales bacterium]
MTQTVELQGRVLAEKYELVKLLGQGGMGAVWEARNHLGKRFAVKLLITQDVAGNPDLAQRFFREAKASAAIESEHIVEVYDTGIDPQTQLPFIIMEMLRGEDLEKMIGRFGPVNVLGCARIIAQAATGLSHAHAAGIIHRDIKPANIFMTTRGPGDFVVKILDFGIAKQALEALSATGGAGLTKTGSMLGTPLYMSPEQARGLKTVDARSDVWSLGMCLYEALSGQTPWGQVDTLGELILSICSRDVPKLQDVAPWVPPELAAVTHRALERDLDKRLPTATSFVEALRPFCEGSIALTPEILRGIEDTTKSTTAPRVSAMPAAGMTAATTSVAAFASSQPGTPTATATEKKKPPIVAIAIAAVAVLGIGGFAASRAMSKSPEPPTTTEPAKAAEKPVEKPSAEKPVEKASAAPTETASAAPPPVVASVAPSVVASSEKPAVATAKSPILGKAPPTKPSASAAPPSSADTVKGRIIRKDL